MKLVDVSYGGDNGFNQAIELSGEVLSNVKFIHEKKLIGRYFDEISQDTNKYCFGVIDTLKALEMGSVDTLVVWENLEIMRYVLMNHASDSQTILHLTPEQEQDKTKFTDPVTGVELELVDKVFYDTYLMVTGININRNWIALDDSIKNEQQIKFVLFLHKK